MGTLDEYLVNQKDDLSKLMESLHDHNDGTPIFMFLHLWATFVFNYRDLRSDHTESDSFDLALAKIADDPLVQNMVAQMMGKAMDRGVGLE